MTTTTDTTTRPASVGDTLPNGALVLASRPSPKHDNSDNRGLVVLAMRTGSSPEFVTWVCAWDGTGTTWGNYFGTDLAEALEDFRTR